MSYLINEKHLGEKQYIEYRAPSGNVAETGIHLSHAFFALNGVEFLKYDSSGISITGLVDAGNFNMSNTQWGDIKVPLTRDKQGVLDKPDYDYTNLGMLFPQNDEAEQVNMIIQFNHDYKLGTNVSPHMHYIQDEAGIPTFIMKYRWIDNGDLVPTFSDAIESTTAVFTYTSGTMMQIIEFPDIDGSGITGVSSMMDLVLYRKTGDGITGDVLVKEFDMHYQIDSLGSNEEYTK